VSELDVGTVNVWKVPGYRIEMSPCGGIKDSGCGYKAGVWEALKSFTNIRTYSAPGPAWRRNRGGGGHGNMPVTLLV
jgi:acyl-CoA reductase-like NAD-dependent aldehyde dehydrogenase